MNVITVSQLTSELVKSESDAKRQKKLVDAAARGKDEHKLYSKNLTSYLSEPTRTVRFFFSSFQLVAVAISFASVFYFEIF